MKKKFKFIKKSYADQWMINLYRDQDISADDFKKLLNEVYGILDSGESVHYNDSHGVGQFDLNNKNKKISYIATHHRHWMERKESLDKEGISDFLRDFFNIGYTYNKIDNWS